MSAGTRSDLLGRVMGMLVFLAGVGLLGWVFYTAYGLFHIPVTQALDLKFTGNPKTDPPAIKVGAEFGWLFVRIGYLFLMSFAGSLIAQKGINLYFSALYGVSGHATLKATPPTVSTPVVSPPAQTS